ncbi:Cation efflux system protein CusB precursor [compost metagenome]
MKRIHLYSTIAIGLLFSCSRKEQALKIQDDATPKVENNGLSIQFPSPKSCSFFKTETIGNSHLNAEITAPANVSAIVLRSEEGASQPIILFANSDLAGNYTQLLQHQININQIQEVSIKQKKIELDRIKDLQQHGAATGRDLLEAQTALAIEKTNLANERAAIIEHETKLKAGGFHPEKLKRSVPGTAYIVCDIPENQIGKVKEGSNCSVVFTAYPNEPFTGKIEDVADMLDNTTRMVKLRVSVNNANNKLKAGMFATISFGISEGDVLSVSKNAVITIQGQNYVFVLKGTAFERRSVVIGNEIGDRIIIFSGLQKNEKVAIKGVMQLKGLSFGY